MPPPPPMSASPTNFKIIIIGDAGVGKSCLATRASDDRYNEECTPTIGADFHMYSTVIDGRPIVAQLWDTAGQEIYADMCRVYYRGANGVIICFDITDRRSFERVVSVWHRTMRDLCEQAIPCLLVGTKADLEHRRAVSVDEAAGFAYVNGMLEYIETSAKTAQRVKECVDSIIATVYFQQQRLLAEAAEGTPGRRPVDLKRSNQSTTKGPSCC
eukprot:GGOE01013960.1.p1 GENE.GGOE01013960.1~~GGOE01013960.1.p1  ORF type:complete len:214 (+),score=61.52 GGOE01013960.1:49-690(+)